MARHQGNARQMISAPGRWPIRASLQSLRRGMAQSMYRIREVDGHDDEIADALADLHRLTFFSGASVPEFDWGHWWLGYHETQPVAFAGVIPSTRVINAGYFCRVGVLKSHRGNS